MKILKVSYINGERVNKIYDSQDSKSIETVSRKPKYIEPLHWFLDSDIYTYLLNTFPLCHEIHELLTESYYYKIYEKE